MISNILGFMMIAAAISTLVFAISAIYRFAKRRKAGWAKYALLASAVVGIASFIALGSTYSPPAELEQLAINQDEERAGLAKTIDAEESLRHKDEQATDQQEDTSQPAALPFSAQRLDAEGPESTSTPAEPKLNTEPDFDAMLEELGQSITAGAMAAVKGRFDATVKPTMNFSPYTGFLLIKAQASDNISAKLLRKGIMADIGDTLEGIHFDAEGFTIPDEGKGIPIYGIERVGFNISFPKTDNHGNIQSEIILKAEYTKEELQKVNWENKWAINFEDLADTFWYAGK